MDDMQRKLVTDWIEDARVLLHTHFSMAESIRGKHRKLGIPAAILSAIVGTSVFATIGNDPSVYIQILVGLTSIAASVLATLSAFLNYSEIAIKHQQTGSGFAAIRKELEEIVAFPPADADELKRTLQDIRARWDQLRKDAIPVSAERLRGYQQKINEDKVLTNESSGPATQSAD